MQDVTKQSAIILDGKYQVLVSVYCLCRDRSECVVCRHVGVSHLWSCGPVVTPAVCGGKVSSFAGLRRPGQPVSRITATATSQTIVTSMENIVAQYSEKAHGESK